MKHVVSISIGSSKRDHRAEIEILGEKFLIERIGTDGDMDLAVAMMRDLDGKVDAFGLGGIDMYIWAGTRRYTIRDSKRFTAVARRTPLVDGSGLKNTLERKVISFLKTDLGMNLKANRVLLVAAVDRFGMAEALAETGCEMVIGDLMFGLGVPIPLRSRAQYCCPHSGSSGCTTPLPHALPNRLKTGAIQDPLYQVLSMGRCHCR